MLILAELKERIIRSMDPDMVVELLDLSTEDILDRFEDVLEERQAKFDDWIWYGDEEDNPDNAY